MKLCRICNLSKGNAFEEGECFVCRGGLASLDELAKRAAEKLPDAPTFSISTKIPNEWLAREDIVWNLKLSKTTCIKTFINLYLSRYIAKVSNKKPKTDGDVLLMIDVATGEIRTSYNDLFIFGRYKKLKAGISQTRWTCSNCHGKGCEECSNTGKFYHSVEEEIGEKLKEECRAQDYILHASGREDIDVVNIGGRPFVIQMIEAHVRNPDLKAVTKRINKKGNVEVEGLMLVDRGAVELVTASHFDKSYIATVEFEREISDAELSKLLQLSGKVIEQRTPERVKHRRANITRKRRIIEVKLITRSRRNATFEITTEAGTYIKELITGDDGRTKPSFSSILEMNVTCKELKVISIHDEFLNMCLRK
ncbi:MAG: tRNA pseudouridine(54/55) synthase Pus10 [Candidatus Bilamarchaeaceae archaeon]